MQTHPELLKVGRSLGSIPSLIDNPHSTNKKVRPSPLSSVKSEYPSLPLRPFRAHRRARVFEWNNSLEDGKVKDSPLKQASEPDEPAIIDPSSDELDSAAKAIVGGPRYDDLTTRQRKVFHDAFV